MKINAATHFLIAEGREKIITNKISPNQKNLVTADGLPRDLIIHYTACKADVAVAVFMKPNSTSAHLVIDTNGDIYQMVAFNRQAFHAGYSVWDDNSAFNGRAIGIELVNMGWDVATLPADQTVAMPHKHRFETHKKWHIYPPAQLKSLYAVTKVLMNQYHLDRILGHDDISAGRKQDPGPAFPWDEYNTAIFGTTNNIGKIFKVNSPDGANLRKGNGVKYDVIRLLPKGYEVGLVETWNNWSEVYLANSSDEVTYKENGVLKNKKISGWIRSDLLSPKI